MQTPATSTVIRRANPNAYDENETRGELTATLRADGSVVLAGGRYGEHVVHHSSDLDAHWRGYVLATYPEYAETGCAQWDTTLTDGPCVDVTDFGCPCCCIVKRPTDPARWTVTAEIRSHVTLPYREVRQSYTLRADAEAARERLSGGMARTVTLRGEYVQLPGTPAGSRWTVYGV